MKTCGPLVRSAQVVNRGFSTTSAALNSEVGFIGLGNMGAHMARNLIKKGHKLSVYDLNPAVVDSLVSLGAKKASRPAEVANGAKVIITMLPSSPHVKEVYLGKDGILGVADKGTLLIDSSTIDPGSAREVAEVTSSLLCLACFMVVR